MVKFIKRIGRDRKQKNNTGAADHHHCYQGENKVLEFCKNYSSYFSKEVPYSRYYNLEYRLPT